MENNKNNKGSKGRKKAPDYIVYSKSDLLKEIAEIFGEQIPKKTLKRVIDAYDNIIQEHLLEARMNTPILIKPFQGLQIQSVITPAQTKDTLFAKNVEIPERILAKAKTTRYYTRLLNDIRSGSEEQPSLA